MIELVTVMILIGIVAVVAIPRMDTSGYSALAFHDKAVSALRYAQKTATSHRRLVCVSFSATTVTLNIAKAQGATACDAALALPSGSASVLSGDATNAIFNPVPATLYFQSDGRGTSDGAGTAAVALSLSISGQPAIVVAGASGHVQ